jgi:hypothetical protein
MRREKVCDRERAPVRLRVAVDGRRVVDRSYAPTGVWHDGNSVAVASLFVRPGAHRVDVEIDDTHDSDEWAHRFGRRLDFTREARRVVSFDRVSGFTVQ